MSIRIGLIGAGTMARDHARALVGVTGAEVVAVADPVLERATEVAALHHARVYADYRDLLDSVDAVWICTPPFLHREQVETCAAAGKHIFAEKPIALTIPDCQAIIDAARRHKVKLAAGHVFRFYPVFQEAHRRLEAGELGDLILCWSKRLGAPPSYLMVPWRTDPTLGGSFMLDVQVHELDFVTWFGGEPVAVRGVITRDDPTYPGIDISMAALITYRNGSVGEVSGSWRAPGKFFQHGIVGTRGTILIDDWENLDRLRLRLEGRDEQVVSTPAPSIAVRAEDEHFLRCIERDEEPQVTGAIGLRAVELALAVIASSDSNTTISLSQ